MMLRVLVACEFSGIVRDAFTARGHFARSVDLLPTESLAQPVKFRGMLSCFDHPVRDPTCWDCVNDEPWCHEHGMYAYECSCLGPTEDEAEYADDCEHGARHLTGDLFTVEDIESYDLLIAHPPCTHLACSGNRWLKRHFVRKSRNGRCVGGYWHDPTEKRRQLKESVDFVLKIWSLPVKRKALENPVGRLSTLWKKPTQIIQPWQYGHGEVKKTCLWLDNLPKLNPTNVVAGREERIWNMPPSEDRGKLRSIFYTGIAEAMADQWS